MPASMVALRVLSGRLPARQGACNGSNPAGHHPLSLEVLLETDVRPVEDARREVAVAITDSVEREVSEDDGRQQEDGAAAKESILEVFVAHPALRKGV